MKLFVSLLCFTTLATLISCQPAATLLSIESTEMDTTHPLIADTTDSVILSDSTSAIDSTITRFISFNSPEAEQMFQDYLSTTPPNFSIIQDDSLYAISYNPNLPDSSTELESILPIPFTSTELQKPVTFKKRANVTLYSPFYDLSHLEQLFVSTDTSIVQISKANSNTLLISTADDDIDAFYVSTMLSNFARFHPAILKSIVGPIKGLNNFVEGQESIVQGINPASTSA